MRGVVQRSCRAAEGDSIPSRAFSSLRVLCTVLGGDKNGGSNSLSRVDPRIRDRIGDKLRKRDPGDFPIGVNPSPVSSTPFRADRPPPPGDSRKPEPKSRMQLRSVEGSRGGVENGARMLRPLVPGDAQSLSRPYSDPGLRALAGV